MKLEKFKTDRSKKIRNILITIGAIIILVGGIIFFRSYALYEEDKTFNVIRGQVPEFSSSDIQIAYTIDGEKSSSFPIAHIYNVDVDCNGTATAEWSNGEWLLKIKKANAEKIKCNVNFTKKEITTLADYIFNLSETDTTNLVYDDTSDSNLRYIGANPNNYLCFDKDCTNGKWRVIGIMNNMSTANGNQSLVKIIRTEYIGHIEWDDNNVNDWTTASLQTSLNSGDLYSKYIEKYNNLFEIVTWNLGGAKSYSSSSNGLASHWYGYERGITVYSNRPIEWSGKIGLMYPSDYGYATSGGTTTDRATCLAENLYNWDDSDVSDCKNNDYLYLDYDEWTLTPASADSFNVSCVDSSGYVECYDADEHKKARPVGYLISNTKISSGDGTSSSPWIIGI
jgi:hypothetical protein